MEVKDTTVWLTCSMSFRKSSNLYLLLLSFGEAFWNPKLYDYTASIAPKGKESSHMAMSQVPMFFAKVAAGPLSGVLLASGKVFSSIAFRKYFPFSSIPSPRFSLERFWPSWTGPMPRGAITTIWSGISHKKQSWIWVIWIEDWKKIPSKAHRASWRLSERKSERQMRKPFWKM